MPTTRKRRPVTKRKSPRTVGDPKRTELLRLLDEAFRGPAWHGPSVMHALRGVSAAEASRQSPASTNTVWDVVLHLAYSKYIVARRLSPQAVAAFPRALRRSWWPGVLETEGQSVEQAWKRDLRLLREWHEHLRELVAALPAVRLGERRPGKRFTLGQEVSGLALHDAYHAGQIRVILSSLR
jgi:uncharacterized damage-inducible protein DinB